MSGDPRSARGATRWIVLALACVVALLYVRPLFLGETFFSRDHVRFMLGSRTAVRDALADGRVPEWNDRVGLGQPLAANPVHGVLYPPALIVTAAVPPAASSDVLVILHALLGALGACALARRLGAGALGGAVAGCAFASAGYVHTMAVNGIPALTLAWTPWVAVAADRLHAAPIGARLGAFARLALVVGLQLLSGDPAGVVTSVLLAGGLTLARAARPGWALLRLAGGVALALPLAAASLLPGLALAADSPRAAGIDAGQATVWSLHPLRLLELVWPQVFGLAAGTRQNLARLVADTGARGQLDASWALALHVGAPVLALAGFGAAAAGTDRRGRLALLALSLGFVLLALGDATPIYGAYRAVMLPERLLRYPEKHLAGAVVLWAALAGVGFGRTFRGADGEARRGAVVLAGAAAVMAGLGGIAWLARGAIRAWLVASLPARPPPVDVDGALAIGCHALVPALLCAVTVAALAALRRHLPRGTGPLAASVIALGLVVAAWPTLPVLPRAKLTTVPSWIARALPPLVDGAPPERLFRRELVEGIPIFAGPADLALLAHQSLGDRLAPLAGLADLPGYDPSLPARHEALVRRGESERLGRLADLFDVRWLILHDSLARWRSTGFALIARSPLGFGLYENPGRRGRAFVATGWAPVVSWEAGLEVAFAPGVDAESVRLEGKGDGGARAGAPRRPCALASPRPERRELACPDGEAGHAVLLDAWSAGWRATVDGVPAPIHRADGVAMAVPVPAGAHAITFTYVTPWLRPGLAISVAAWWLLLGVLLRDAVRARRTLRATAVAS